MPRKKGNAPLKNWAKFSTIALQMGLIIFLSNKLGVWLDQKFEYTFFTNTCTLIGVFFAMLSVIQSVKQINK